MTDGTPGADGAAEPEPGVPETPGVLKVMLRAFGHRNYRLFFIGQTVSLIGSWMQQTAIPWLVYDQTKDPFLLGLVGFCTHIPAFILAPLAGVAADRWDRRHILLIAQAVAMVQALLLGLLTLAGWIDIGQIILLSFVAGVAAAFNLPAAQAFVSDIVEKKEDLPSAIALNAAMTNLTRMLAPALAGVLISVITLTTSREGEAACFLLNGVSYLAVLASLWVIRPAAASKPFAKGAIGGLASLKEGFSYVLGSPPLRDLLLLAALVGLVGTPSTLIPVFADKIAPGNASTFGLLMGATGLGALVGAAYVAARRGIRGSGQRIAGGTVILGVALIGFAYSPYLWPAIGFRFLAGLALVVQMTSCTTLVQTVSDDDKRGRVMSIYAMAFLGMSPLGNLLAGSLASASAIGPEATFLIFGISCLVAAGWFLARLPRLREMLRGQFTQGHKAGDA